MYDYMQIFCNSFQLLNQWVAVIGRSDMVNLVKEVIRNRYRVCERHFTPEHFFIPNKNRTNLKRDAIPNLYVRGKLNDHIILIN